MVYTEYKNASIRHLESSLYMVEFLDEVKDVDEERSILLDIYYLAGYTIECIVNYAIYNYIRFNASDDVKSLNPNVFLFDEGFYTSYSVPGSRTSLNPRFVIASHNFRENCQFFAYHNITDANRVPHFDGLIPDRALIPLFNNWKPEVRYIDYGFSKNEIIKFVNLSKEIHHKTRQYITKD